MSAPRFTIRPMLPADLPEVTDLWVASWQATLPEIDFEARRAWLVDHLDALAGDGHGIHVALSTETGDVVGFTTLAPGTGYLDQLAVHPAHWGTGAAEALLDAARALSPRVIMLDVNAENPRAVRFYEKQGFRIEAEGANARSGRPTYTMVWRAL